MTKLLRASALYAIISSICMLIFWVIYFIGSELSINSISFWFLIIDEAITCIGLLISGISLMRKKKWALQLFYTSMGMLLYAVIYGSGKFASIGNIYISELFILVAITTSVLIFIHFFINKE